MKFENLDVALATAKKHTVTTLDLSNQKLKALPDQISVFHNLRVLDLTNTQLATLPSAIGQLKNLTRLHLNRNQLCELPVEISQLSKLQRLEIDHNTLQSLPDNIGDLQKLRYLSLGDNQLKALPDSLGNLMFLEMLDISNNQFATFPPSITKLKLLQSLLTQGNQFTKIPQDVFHMSNLVYASGLGQIKQRSPRQILSKFKEIYQKTTFPEAHYEDFQKIFLGNDQQVKTLPVIRLFEALTIPEDHIRKHALDYILQLPNANFPKKPLTDKSVLTFVGDTSFKKNEVKERLLNHNIGYSPKISPQTTHIVVGLNPKDYEAAAKKKYTYLSEQQLNDFLNSLATPYLLQEEEDASLSIENLRGLLTSTDPANMGVAIGILKGGGVPDELLTEVFFVAKVASDKKTREGAKELVNLYGKKTFQKALNHKEKLGTKASGSDAEKKTYKKLRKYASLSKDIEWGKIAYYHYLQYQHGLRFFFDYEPIGSELRKKVLQSLIEGTSLNFFKAYATYMPSYEMPYAYEYYQPKPFPEDILEFATLTDLNIAGCYIEAIPDDIHRLSHLQKLNCSGNFLSTLPDSLPQLAHLQVLNISNNEFKEFPAIIAQMPQLKEVICHSNRDRYESNPLKIPKEIKTALPHCRFVIR